MLVFKIMDEWCSQYVPFPSMLVYNSYYYIFLTKDPSAVLEQGGRLCGCPLTDGVLILIVLRVDDLLTCTTCIHEPYNMISGTFGYLSKAGGTQLGFFWGGRTFTLVFFCSLYIYIFLKRHGILGAKFSTSTTNVRDLFLKIFGGFRNPDIVEGQHRHDAQ